MPTMHLNGIRLHYEESGNGAETVVFAHGLLWDMEQFATQIGVLQGNYRCLAYDHRGQGQSQIPRERTIALSGLYQDAVTLLERRVMGPCHFVGADIGGHVGMMLAARRPDLIRSLVLIGTSAEAETPENITRYKLLSATMRLGVGRLMLEPIMALMFGRTFLTSPHHAERREELRQHLLARRRRLYRALRGVMARPSLEDEVARINTPTLILRGEEDVLVSQESCKRLHERLHTSMLVNIPNAGHNCTVEQPEAVLAALETFFEAFSGVGRRSPRSS